VRDEGTFILMADEATGKEKPVTVEEYKEKLAVSLVESAENMELLREMWIHPVERRHLIEVLPGGEKGALMLRELLHLNDCDLFDLFAEIGFGVAAKSRAERVSAFDYKNKRWLLSLPSDTSSVILLLANQFKENGIEELESAHVFDVSEIKKAGGIRALAKLGADIADAVLEVKKRLLAA
ncbi:MAG: type I restriction-modification enzyme R subunit C-terminal domain-containing protein, partial [Candidatus Thermoplasmatota archaeon]|nr:type I restriction-modification enzyme R subunit C-terminal domain-containing protein [Candidatus Thermoplasmatota archaeon]